MNDLLIRAKARQEAERVRILERCAKDPMYWATTWTKTEDEHAQERGLEPKRSFPDKEYLYAIVAYLLLNKRTFCPKSRDMQTSWTAMMLATHMCQFYPANFFLIQTNNEEKARHLIGYAWMLYENQEPWMREHFPLSPDCIHSRLHISWQKTGKVMGIPGGTRQIATFHPTGYIQDEAAFWPEFLSCYAVADPVAGWIWSISSAGPGDFANECEEPVGEEVVQVDPMGLYQKACDQVFGNAKPVF